MCTRKKDVEKLSCGFEVFRKNGKFLKSIGEKGGAPFEFFKPRSFAIDREKSKLLFMTIRNGSGCIFL